MRFVGLVLSFLLLSNCLGQPHLPLRPEGGIDLERLAKVKSQTICERLGGEMRSVCMMGMQTCVVPYSDGGKSCTDSTQCMGDCWISLDREEVTVPKLGQPTTGVCQENTDHCGCFVRVTGGKAEKGICID